MLANLEFEKTGRSWAANRPKDFSSHLHCQSVFLRALGIDICAQALAKAYPDKAEEPNSTVFHLNGVENMGVLFKCFCLSSRGLA